MTHDGCSIINDYDIVKHGAICFAVTIFSLLTFPTKFSVNRT